MRRIVLATAVTLAILAVGSFVPNCADAMTVTIPTGIQAAVEDNSLVQDVACRRVLALRALWLRLAPRLRTAVLGYGGPYYYGGGPLLWPSRYHRRYWW